MLCYKLAEKSLTEKSNLHWNDKMMPSISGVKGMVKLTKYFRECEVLINHKGTEIAQKNATFSKLNSVL